jgi:hypothetical protein
MWFIFLSWASLAGVFEKYTAQQDPRVEEAIRLYAKTMITLSKAYNVLWKVWKVDKSVKPPAGPLEEPNFPYLIEQLKSLEKEVQGYQPSQAIIDFLLAMSYRSLDEWEFENLIYGGILNENSRKERLFRTPKGSFIDVPYNPLYAEEALRFQMKAMEYDSNMYIAFLWKKETDEVFYIVNWRDKEEYRQWFSALQERTRLFEEGRDLYGTYFIPAKRVYAGLESLYLLKGDLLGAIYCLERAEKWWMEDFPRLTIFRVMRAYGPEALAGVRMLYLQQLKKSGDRDKLHPFLYINTKIFDTAHCLTRNGNPFVAVVPFLKALNMNFDWEAEGKSLTIKRGNENIGIERLNDEWKIIYKGKEKKDIEVYLKDEEIYLPLKELCELLGLKLQWDEETYIGRVISGSIGK